MTMGMNFYVRLPECPNPCAHCNAGEEVHLGKSSTGWTFSFRGYPAGGPGFGQVTDYQEWLDLARRGKIVDEHGEEKKLPTLLAMIDSKRGGKNELIGSDVIDDFIDEYGHRFTNTEFC